MKQEDTVIEALLLAKNSEYPLLFDIIQFLKKTVAYRYAEITPYIEHSFEMMLQ